MNTSPNFPPSSDEKLMGALAHLFGPMVAIIVWATQKDKSRFVKFQALQALAFDIFLMLTMGIIFFCLFGTMFVGIFGSMFGVLANTSSPDTGLQFLMLPFMFPFITFACIFPFSISILILRIIAAMSILNGRNYQYPLLGKWLENFLKE